MSRSQAVLNSPLARASLGLLATVMLLIVPACAEDSSARVSFLAYPPHSRVVLPSDFSTSQQDVFLGEADGAALPVPEGQLLSGRADYQFRIDHEGYESQRVTVKDWRHRGLNDGGAPVRLHRSNPVHRLWDEHRIVAVAALALLVGGIAFVGRRMWVRYRRDSETLASSVSRSAVLDPDDPLIGQEMGGFRLIERLGAGATAAVYRATDAGPGPKKLEVAVKVIDMDLSRDDEFRRRFEREARVGVSLNHPALVRVLDAGLHDERLFLVMDLVLGTSLRDVIASGPLSPGQAVALLRPVFEGVHAAHDGGVIHRDLKPENILRMANGQMRILDFGLARSDSYTRITQTGAVLGTAAYLAPEQIMESRADAATDQYALGIITYELLAGRPPFEGDAFVVMTQQYSEDPPLLRSLAPDVSEAVAAAVARMLEKDPSARFASVTAALEALEAALQAP